ncbi:MAG: ribosome-associated translation inhibitor RaiA [Candidatus Omnitrophica bacterium]|nr:ribosome-associated translation inhibitor RaiA [Candidatus Omnitrophota bacterium]
MHIRMTGHKMTVTAGMRQHLEEKLSRYEKFASKLVESHVVLKKQKYFFEAEITLLAKHLKAFGLGKSKENVFSAIDQAFGKVEKQLKKYREKIKDHRVPNAKEIKGVAEVIAAKSRAKKEDRPAIIPAGSAPAKPMSKHEASSFLQSSAEPFFVFYNSQSERTNLIYKREDGHHGLLEM